MEEGAISDKKTHKPLAPLSVRVFKGAICNTVNLEIFVRVYFRETSHVGSFVKKNPRKITLSFNDILKSCPSRKFLNIANMCLLLLFAKIKCSRKFPNLQ